MKSIKNQIEIKSTPEQLFQAITSEKGIMSWWTNDVKIEPSEGLVAEIGFYNRSIVLEFRIEILTEDSVVQWVCLSGPDEYLNSKIIFDITPSENDILLLFEHSNLNGSDEFINHAADSWKRVLSSLKSYVETGQGNPISM